MLTLPGVDDLICERATFSLEFVRPIAEAAGLGASGSC